jgi:hypothetical protein
MEVEVEKRLFITAIAAITLLIVSVVVVSWLLKTQDLSLGWRLGLVLLPVTSFAIWLTCFRRLIQRLDELQQRIHLEALVFAFSALAVAIIACEYLRKAGVISLLKPDYVLLMMLILWAIGFLVAWRRYR